MWSENDLQKEKEFFWKNILDIVVIVFTFNIKYIIYYDIIFKGKRIIIINGKNTMTYNVGNSSPHSHEIFKQLWWCPKKITLKFHKNKRKFCYTEKLYVYTKLVYLIYYLAWSWLRWSRAVHKIVESGTRHMFSDKLWLRLLNLMKLLKCHPGIETGRISYKMRR